MLILVLVNPSAPAITCNNINHWVVVSIFGCILKHYNPMKWFSMLDHEHKPVSLVGLLLLVAATLIFLVAIWTIGSAFARP